METFKCFWKRCLGLVSRVTGGGYGHILYLAIWGRSGVFLTAVCGLVRVRGVVSTMTCVSLATVWDRALDCNRGTCDVG